MTENDKFIPERYYSEMSQKAAEFNVDNYYQSFEYPSNIKRVISNSEDLFFCGAEWQRNNLWISVEEVGYPPYDKKCEIDKRKRYLLRFVSGSISQTVSYKVGYLAREDRFVGEMDWVSVTHWMPIPEMKKGE